MGQSVRYNRRALRALRLKRGWSRDQLATEARVTKNALSYLERGLTEPKARTLAKLAGALGVSPNDFYEPAG